ncbi:ROK family protein [uncultured Jatrophihabitans sp.]|uniref:ROK family protein n=1 Tax=uncultured Jatrophihabitans sp. TaxID=1610747 RepID=UPI0035CB0803
MPVLEVGGTHVSAALVDPDGWTVSGAVRRPLDANADADELVGAFVAAARAVAAPPGMPWGVAMPDPFDYRRGVALFDAAVAKFGALHGVDVGAALRADLDADVFFLNDADAFTLGEWTAGVGRGAQRLAGITLGTGVGSGWVVDGQVVDPGFPPGGRIHQVGISDELLGIWDEPLEDLFSRRAIRASFAAAGGDPAADVREVAALARAGDGRATRTLTRALRFLGMAVGRAVAEFRADVLVIGGSMAASWDLFEPWFRTGAEPPGRNARPLPEIRVSVDAERSGFVGAAVYGQSPHGPEVATG